MEVHNLLRNLQNSAKPLACARGSLFPIPALKQRLLLSRDRTRALASEGAVLFADPAQFLQVPFLRTNKKPWCQTGARVESFKQTEPRSGPGWECPQSTRGT
jgi:hypothetical protein